MANEEISWDEATASSGFVTLKSDEAKILEITNWRFEKKPMDSKVAAGQVELLADVLIEDGEAVKEKIFATTSNRLKTKLRPILEKRKPDEVVKISILRVGEQFNTQYSVKELTE